MNEYRVDHIPEGTVVDFEVDITQEMVDQFTKLSGDCNPLHTERGFALQSGFSGRVVHGLLTSAFYSRLVGVYLPGRRCLLQGIDIAFKYPVYIGDTLRVSGRVAYLNEAYRQLEVKAQITNQDGRKVSTAKIKVGENG
jgi:3-hydroxybutyryl-CoA dehydratase